MSRSPLLQCSCRFDWKVQSQAQNDIFLVLENLPEWKQCVNRRPNKTEGLGQGNQKLYAHLQQHIDKVTNWHCYSLSFFTSSSKFSQKITLNCPWDIVLWFLTITLWRKAEGKATESLIPSHNIHFFQIMLCIFLKHCQEQYNLQSYLYFSHQNNGVTLLLLYLFSFN